MQSEAASEYARRRDVAAADASALGRRAGVLSLCRVLAVLAALGLAAGAQWGNLGLYGWASSAACAVAFLALALVHDGVLTRKTHAQAVLAWNEEGLARLEHRWMHDPRAIDPKPDDAHPYAGDLDVFGRGSLMQSLDTTRSREGRALLAAWLSTPADAAEISLRQACARDLAPRVDLREDLAVEGALVSAEPPDVAPLLAWAEGASGAPPSTLLVIIALALPALTLTLLIAGATLPVPRALWVVTLGAQVLLTMRYRALVTGAIGAASEHHHTLARYQRMLAIVESARFDAAPLETLRAQLTGRQSADASSPSSDGATVELRRLGRIVGFVDARQNEVFRLFIGPLLNWDLNCALALEGWRRRAGAHIRRHLAALARIEALCALGARAYERPDDAWPDVTDGACTPVLEGIELGHPLIERSKVVRNDVTLDAQGSVLLVTGSNMSGKSTLLRAIGTNVVLALAGAPVRAKSMRLAAFEVHTSMRVRDSLSEGVSHFLAELRRLKEVVDAADAAASRQVRPVLFLLDEILHGTNSRERHLGARAIVRHLVAQHACGAVSTHDLALGALETELPGHVRNVHFREQIEAAPTGGETMTFDYHLRPGVVTSSNALRLMRMVGIEIAIPPEEAIGHDG